ncbi:Pex12 amino terminal region-domain-containing protein [Neohortaea acidophila]|uniref:Pex12 amino terminal region-domain-containing protein n=1 Tax=Neohortaea acidophila TaxID=245834 RepID=A0A6A6PMD1_9PEZI|nr:Pex12 amino terminal region-domain-containing protein [Neohortaea acidophila]KAF2481209.1 Pex12 amino terminal region-domain-containing protein [Neohortaea acidophila]
MTDFAAAQERILARRAAREASFAAVRSEVTTSRAERLLHLPPALRVAAHQAFNFWDLIKSPYSTQPAFRVGQVDAELLDEELLNLLKNQAGEGLKLFGAHLKDDYAAEISLFLRTILWKLSIWDHGASYGASLQGLKYIDARAKNTAARAEATATQRAAYGLLTVGGRYAWSRWEDRLSAIENSYDTEPSPLINRLSRVTNFLGSAHNVAAFVSFLIFLYNGKYRTLTDRLLRMRLVPSSNQTSREVSFEFLNRQLVWHAFTEFLLFLLPLVGISRWKRWLARAWKKTKTSVANLRSGEKVQQEGQEGEEGRARTGELSFLPERTCAICYQDQNATTGKSEQDVISAGANAGIIGNSSTDITNPYETVECGCIYCYACVAKRIEAEEGEGWICLRCGELVKECRPWSGDVEAPVAVDVPRRSSRKSIAWADELVEKEGEEDRGDDEVPMQQMAPTPFDKDGEEEAVE